MNIFVEKDLLTLFNICNIYVIRECDFSERRKTAQLVILYKGNGKPITDPSSLRPLYLLDNVAKLMERLVLARFNKTLEDWGVLENRKFRFSSDRGSIQIIKEVLIIINPLRPGRIGKNVCVSWSPLTFGIHSTRLPESYKCRVKKKKDSRISSENSEIIHGEKKILMLDNAGHDNMHVRVGVPPGSVSDLPCNTRLLQWFTEAGCSLWYLYVILYRAIWRFNQLKFCTEDGYIVTEIRVHLK